LVDDALNGLERELHAPVPPGLLGLGDSELRDLTTAIADERHRQAAALAAAGDQALGQLPRMIRIPLQKLLG
jgi:hypothetical protein